MKHRLYEQKKDVQRYIITVLHLTVNLLKVTRLPKEPKQSLISHLKTGIILSVYTTNALVTTGTETSYT